MKKQLLFTLGIIMTFSLSYLNGQTHGPGPFETYYEDFEDGEAQGWVGILNSQETDWTVVDASGVNDQGTMQLNNRGEGDAMLSAIYDDASFQNYEVSAIIYPGWGNKTGIIFNYQDEDNFYVVEHFANANTLLLRHKIDGNWDVGGCGDDPDYCWDAAGLFLEDPNLEARVDTNVASDWVEGLGVYNTMRVVCKTDGVTSVYFNDNLIFEDIELTALPDHGKVGIYTHWNNVWVDNFQVKALDATGILDEQDKYRNNLVYPNPVNGNIFTVDASQFSAETDLYIYNLTGKLVYSESLRTGRKITLNAAETLKSRGMYIFSLTSKDKKYTGKISY